MAGLQKALGSCCSGGFQTNSAVDQPLGMEAGKGCKQGHKQPLGRRSGNASVAVGQMLPQRKGRDVFFHHINGSAPVKKFQNRSDGVEIVHPMQVGVKLTKIFPPIFKGKAIFGRNKNFLAGVAAAGQLVRKKLA